MRPDSSAIANALIAKLGADTELLGYVPNGIYEDVAQPPASRFVIVSQILATDGAVFSEGRVFEDALFLVEARVLSSTKGDVRAAAARIDALLEDGNLAVPGYRFRGMYREEFVRGTEVDDVDPTIVWKRRGGRYRVQMTRELQASAVAAEQIYPTRAEQFGLIDVAIWFDGPLKVPNPADVLVGVTSSDPTRYPDFWLALDVPLSTLDVTDPAAPGRAVLRWRRAFDTSALAGMTFTLSDDSGRTLWSRILNRVTGAPVADTLGSVVLVVPVLP